ncbi:MAG: L,D-transpeptidase family protein [Pseudomonadota bacterium]
MKPSDLVVTKWAARYRGRSFSCAIGRGGIGAKLGEGDGVTPVGLYRLCLIGLRPDRVSLYSDVPQRPIGPRDIWSDDPKHDGYNSWQKGPFARFSHEALRRSDHLYDLIGVLDFNWPEASPGAGSAIFLHTWRKPRHPTEGCIAFDPGVVAHICATWDPRARVVIRC